MDFTAGQEFSSEEMIKSAKNLRKAALAIIYYIEGLQTCKATGFREIRHADQMLGENSIRIQQNA